MWRAAAGWPAVALGLALLASPSWAAPRGAAFVAGGQTFSTWSDYYASDYFVQSGKRCGTPKPVAPAEFAPSDCSFTSTNPSSDYDTVALYEIPVVVHVIEDSSGAGQISDALVHSQIDVLNEDFRALTGTPGAGGYDVGIQFVLATTDPTGNPTNGITHAVDDTWFADGGSYWNSLAWDTSRYLNVYTNEAGGNLGYVPNLPQGGLAGDPADRVVILWSAFGRDALGGPPYDQGRTLTHEVGHYLGLVHTFEGGCAAASPPTCYSSGDLVCDTNSEADPRYGCPTGAVSCSSLDPIENYMDYTDDTCMDLFTTEQSHRMRCSLLHYRSDLYHVTNPAVCGNDLLEVGEQCDGSDAAACPGACSASCTCPGSCGDGTCSAGEGALDCPVDCGCSAPGTCGLQAQDGCYCDAQCESFGDCCPDACPACGFDCTAAPSCGSAPTSPCRTTSLLGATLIIRDRADAVRDKLVWKAKRLGATTLDDFADPVAPGTTGSLCLYDASATPQPLLAAAVASGGTCGTKDCWKAQRSRGFKYADKSGSADGIKRVKLKAGEEGKAQVQVVAGGVFLALPAPPLQLPVVVQYLVDDGASTSCWQSELTLPIRNEPGLLKAKGP